MKHREKVTSYLDSLIKKGTTPGLQYAAVNGNQVLFTYQRGYSDISKNTKVTEKTTFNGFSITKTFTALAILQLAEQNKLSIDDSITKYIIKNPYGEDVTIRQLLTHTAGLPNPIPLKWIHLIEEDMGLATPYPVNLVSFLSIG
ncbi:beta-lactamase family protein [Alkaliphilus pronyensis]|uniref:Beta-lactamase family protein n=1 Tax=Alkaliphilus pronyensis TaxID=1482732 RepID=A0A6I0F8K5_9FIRM|nr:serine hydrolase domain-containing protein [Alkaliphilus pronyensis]KAB3532374.1 beta-lactamase family protein [Alkaliphilus pronyensis]